jgi:hypothetical protein
MLHWEIIAVCSQIHTKQIHCGQNVEFLYVKPGGTYSNQCAKHIYWRLEVLLTINLTLVSRTVLNLFQMLRLDSTTLTGALDDDTLTCT